MNDLKEFGWTLLAAIAGAVTAISFQPWQGMSRPAIAMSLFVGAAFAVFVGPWVVRGMFGPGPVDLRAAGGVFYLLATGSNLLIPLLVKRFSGFVGLNVGNGDKDSKP